MKLGYKDILEYYDYYSGNVEGDWRKMTAEHDDTKICHMCMFYDITWALELLCIFAHLTDHLYCVPLGKNFYSKWFTLWRSTLGWLLLCIMNVFIACFPVPLAYIRCETVNMSISLLISLIFIHILCFSAFPVPHFFRLFCFFVCLSCWS